MKSSRKNIDAVLFKEIGAAFPVYGHEMRKAIEDGELKTRARIEDGRLRII
jgi:hypothetical protein